MMKFKTAFLCGMLLQGVDSYIQGLRRVPLSGPLQTLGPSTRQYADLSFNECGIECTLDSNCTGISYNPGSPIDGAESKCWTGRFHPFYVAEQGDVDHSHPFWAAYSQTEICEAPDSIMKNEDEMPLGYEVGSDGNWYFRSTNKVSRAKAKEICESAPGGRLAVPETEAELSAIWGYKNDEKIWIGLEYAGGADPSVTVANSTGIVYQLDGSPFIHHPYIRKIQLTRGPCIIMVKAEYYKFARSEYCYHRFIYLCQIRVVQT